MGTGGENGVEGTEGGKERNLTYVQDDPEKSLHRFEWASPHSLITVIPDRTPLSLN
jgi:hypothetical protein